MPFICNELKSAIRIVISRAFSAHIKGNVYSKNILCSQIPSVMRHNYHSLQNTNDKYKVCRSGKQKAFTAWLYALRMIIMRWVGDAFNDSIIEAIPRYYN